MKNIIKTNFGRIIAILCGLLFLCFLLCSAVFFYLLFTEKGSAFLFQKFIKTVNGKALVWKKHGGTFVSGMEYEDIVLQDLKWFPTPNELKAQGLKIDINSFSINGIELHVDNARLILPEADPIVFHGKIVEQMVDFNFYSNSITNRELKGFLKRDILNKVTGSLAGIDVFVKGTIDEPILSGEFVAERIVKNGFSLEQAPCVFNLTLKSLDSVLGIYGFLTIRKGVIKGNKTALIRLQESKLLFNGDPAKPNFDIKATSVVEMVKMNIALKGSFQEPDLQINSEPTMSKERLLLALATNKTWKNTEEHFNKGALSPDLAGDFIDYFIFGGQGNKFAEKFGLKSFSAKYDSQVQGLSVSRDISDRLEGKYEVEQKRKEEGNEDIKQKIGAEYKFTDSVSVGAEKELKGKEKNEDFVNEINEPEAENKVYLKYKKDF